MGSVDRWIVTCIAQKLSQNNFQTPIKGGGPLLPGLHRPLSLLHCVSKNTWTSSTQSWTRLLSVYNNFWHTYYQEYRPSTDVFISYLTYFVHLLYLAKLSKSKYQWKIKENHENFTGRCDSDYKSLYVKAVWCMKAVEWIAQQGLETRKHRQSAEENQDGYNVRQSGSSRPRSSRSSGGPCAKKAPISSWDFAWNCHSLFKCAQNNSLWSPAQMFQATSCSAVVWSQSHLPCHLLLNNLIVCNKSRYCCIMNPKLNSK